MLQCTLLHQFINTQNTPRENLDLLALHGTDYMIKLGLEGGDLLLQKVLPRFQKSIQPLQQNAPVPSWLPIVSNKHADNFYKADSLVFKHIHARFKSYVKKHGLSSDVISFIAWYRLYGDEAMALIMMHDLSF